MNPEIPAGGGVMSSSIEPEGENSSPEEQAARAKQVAREWLDRAITREEEFDKGWWKYAGEAVDLYEADAKSNTDSHNKENPYNILYSNTEVLLPSLYSSTPKPDIRARFKDADLKPIPDLIERFLTVAADPGTPGQDNLDSAMSDAVLSGLTAGMGYVRIRYVESQAFPLTYESGSYKTLIWGKATRWPKVQWLAFKHAIPKSTLFKQFSIADEDQGKFIPPDGVDDIDDKNVATVYELWDKVSRKVYFLSEQWDDLLIQESDDPLGLAGFFPTPGLLMFTAKSGKISPLPLFQYYKNQAQELNRVTVRLNRVISAIKVRGAYNPLLGEDMGKILSSDETENGLVAAGEAGLLAQSGGFDKHIWMLPIENLITVAQQLYAARENIKQVIYELTGISDIIRGSSVASETATAQDLKNKWGTIRLRKMQTSVANYVRDIFRMSVDCGAAKVPAALWKKITQLPIPLASEKQAAQQQVAYNRQNAQAQAQATGQPPQPNPQDQQFAQMAQIPSLEETLAKISEDQNRTFTINVQTSSTIDLDTAQDKSEVQDFMLAMGQLVAGLQPIASLGPTGLEASKTILVAVCQRFKFGLQIVDAIKAIQAPAPAQQQNPQAQAAQAQMAHDQQIQQMELQQKTQEGQAKAQLAEAKYASELRVIQARESLALAQVEAEKEQLGLTIQQARLRHAAQASKLAATPKPNAPLQSPV